MVGGIRITFRMVAVQFSIIYKTTAVLYWVGGWYTYYVSEENWGLDGKPQRGSPRHSNHQQPEMLLEKVFESVSFLYLLLPKTGSNNIKKNKIQKSPLSRNAA